MIYNQYIDAQDANGLPAGNWYFINSTNSGNNTGIIFGSLSGFFVNNVDVRDSYANPAYWVAQGDSVNSGNNTNWLFDTTPNKKNLGFFMFLT